MAGIGSDGAMSQKGSEGNNFVVPPTDASHVMANEVFSGDATGGMNSSNNTAAQRGENGVGALDMVDQTYQTIDDSTDQAIRVGGEILGAPEGDKIGESKAQTAENKEKGKGDVLDIKSSDPYKSHAGLANLAAGFSDGKAYGLNADPITQKAREMADHKIFDDKKYS